MHLEERVESLTLSSSAAPGAFSHSGSSLFSELSMSQNMSQSTDSMEQQVRGEGGRGGEGRGGQGRGGELSSRKTCPRARTAWSSR